MDEALLLSVLCEQESWSWNPEWSMFIKFNRDGTGEFWYLGDIGVLLWIAKIEWRSLPLLPKDEDAVRAAMVVDQQTTSAPSSSISSWLFGPKKPELLGRLHVEITLLPDVPDSALEREWHGFHKPNLNRTWLHETAFNYPRNFIIAIERGEFIPEFRVGHENEFERRWGLRLLFLNESPAPRRECFNRKDGRGPFRFHALEGMKMFVAKELPKEEKRGWAMNADPWSYGVAGWVRRKWSGKG